jgi:hypothetical protein
MADSTLDADLVVLGGTAAGVATAVRAARSDLEATLVTYNAHLGGMMAGGLSRTDSYVGTEARTPLLEAFWGRIATHYCETYGRDSTQYDRCDEGFLFEPHVAEAVFDDLVEEAGVTVHREYRVAGVERDGRSIRSLTVERFSDASSETPASGQSLELTADTFVDATYEGDLAATAGVPYRVGRESRWEYGEQYAGRLFSEKGTRLFPGSTGVGDDAVQAYDYRVCLTDDPDNRLAIPKPASYDREEFLPIVEDPIEAEGDVSAWDSEPIACHLKSELVRLTREEVIEQGFATINLLRGPLPNDKYDLNTADLPGRADEYPDGDWETRREIAREHRDHVLGLVYFFQHDDAVPDPVQEEARQYGLPADEFTDNDHFPFQLYVREGRRIEGRATFTERDAREAEGLQRAPINDGSIAIGEYAMDSHDCRPVRRPGSLCDGHFYLGEVTVPSQIPYDAMLPAGLDNLVVPVALSATHVGFGTIRLEPTWFQLGEVAGYATVLADERETTPGDLDADALQRRLAEDGGLLTYFHDVAVDDGDPWIPALQYLGTEGFFASYDARPEEALEDVTAERWARFAAEVRAGEGSPMERARSLPDASGETVETVTDGAGSGTDGVTAEAFVSDLTAAFDRHELPAEAPSTALAESDLDGGDELTRGAACELCYDLVTV